MTGRTEKVDLHLHSYASNVTDYYAANTFAIPESYSDPIATWHELRRQGMTLVTLTDHNSIDGVKEMLDAQLPDVFISAEMTTTFPEDGCNIHVTVANMTEAQFAEVNRLRGNLYEMLAFVEDQVANEAQAPAGNRLAYWMTHPLMSTQNRPYGREGALTADHIEKAMLLFPCLEVQNGTRTRSLNEFTRHLLESLDAATMHRLADKHGITPRGPLPWRKAIVGGSDDHSGINPGQTWTWFESTTGRPATANDLVDAIRARRTAPAGAHGGPVTLAHAMVKLMYDGSRLERRNDKGKGVGMGGPINTLLKFVFDRDSVRLRDKVAFQGRVWLQKLWQARAGRRRRVVDQPFEMILACEARALLADKQFKASLATAKRTDDRIFAVVSNLVNRIFQRYVARIAAAESLDMVRVIKEVVALVTSNVFVSLPYLLSYLHQSSDRMIVRDVRKRFGLHERAKLVLVTDTFFEINGVARTIRRMIDEASRRDLDFTVVTCVGDAERDTLTADPAVRAWLAAGRLQLLPSVTNLDFPGYQGLQIRVPPFLELLKFLQENGFTKMQISTPGTVGVAGLLAAKLLQIETSSTYHTSFPEYVEDYTRDISLEALAWKYMILFYHSVDEVVVPSKFIARLLHQRGLRNRKLLILDRWVDTTRFSPAKRTPGFWRRFGLAREDEVVKFLYVGRVGLEKNLDVMADAFARLCAETDDAHLIVVGDGPYRAALQAKLKDLPVTFTGFLEGDDLLRAFASADVKLFPSTTDTWGNAPLEAQAAGLPVVVSDKGGPHELMRDGVTGYVVKGRDVGALHAAMVRLMDCELRYRLGEQARAFTVQNRIDAPFSAILDSDEYRRMVKRKKKLARLGAADPDLEVDLDDEAAEVLDTVERYLVDHREVGDGRDEQSLAEGA
ncbi:MAG: glycosyltransferase [Planctomycetes bacterium]|nr:glycosyltransferase [Planctomycetota bacterium]